MVPPRVERVARTLAAADVLKGMMECYSKEERSSVVDDVFLSWIRYSDLARLIVYELERLDQTSGT